MGWARTNRMVERTREARKVSAGWGPSAVGRTVAQCLTRVDACVERLGMNGERLPRLASYWKVAHEQPAENGDGNQ